MRILFISNTNQLDNPYKDHSTRYRCYNFAEELLLQGHQPAICPLATVSHQIIDDFDLVVFHRPLYSRKLVRLIRQINQAQKPVFADFDDLLFCINGAETSPRVVNKNASLHRVAKRHKKYQRALRLFDRVTVSTDALASELEAHHPGAEVCTVPNGLSSYWLKKTTSTVASLPKTEFFQVGYFPGTNSHSADFSMIEKSICQFLTSYPEARLNIVGPLSLPESLIDHPRVVHQSAVPYDRLSALIFQCGVAIAPLENTGFNRCKSNIKLLESVACGVPLIASPIPDMERIRHKGVYIAHNQSEWVDFLEKNYIDWGHDRDFEVSPQFMASDSMSKLLLFWGVAVARRGGKKGRHIEVFGLRDSSCFHARKFRAYRKTRKLLTNPLMFIRDSWLLRKLGL